MQCSVCVVMSFNEYGLLSRILLLLGNLQNRFFELTVITRIEVRHGNSLKLYF